MCKQAMFQLSGVVTVDDERPDDFLAATETRYQQLAPGRLFAHADQAGAIARSQAATGEANIVGHGKPGLICTGCGLLLNTNPFERIEVGNIGNWMPSGITKLTLLGCNTGEGEFGADLLFAIAQATGATVSAPTGHVYIGGGCIDFFLEPGTRFQTATPTARPAAIIDDLPLQFAVSHLRLATKPVLVGEDIGPAVVAPFPIGDVASIQLYGPGPISPERRAIRGWFSPDDVVVPIRHIEFDRPVRRGFPAAIETGRLALTLRAPGEQPARVFRIFNDNKLQDMEYPEVQYRANVGALRAMLA